MCARYVVSQNESENEKVNSSHNNKKRAKAKLYNNTFKQKIECIHVRIRKEIVKMFDLKIYMKNIFFHEKLLKKLLSVML
jgi:hypothetical protein